MSSLGSTWAQVEINFPVGMEKQQYAREKCKKENTTDLYVVFLSLSQISRAAWICTYPPEQPISSCWSELDLLGPNHLDLIAAIASCGNWT
jgi:hypothetical protein